MADYTEQERAELQRRVNEELAIFGRLLEGTQDDVRDAGVGVKGFSKQVRQSTGDVFSAYKDLTKQLYNGAQGQAVFNNAIETTATAVAAFGLLMGGPVIKAVSIALIGLAKAIGLANEQSDKVFDAYNRLSDVGATAADQMSGLRNESARLGYVIADNNEGLQQFSDIIANNADSLALFKGTVFEGRQALAGVADAFAENRTDLRKMGIGINEQNKGMANYIRLQTTLGQAQQMTYKQLADGTNKYLQETQALASLTGQRREEVQQEMQRALQEQRFRAKIDELYATGQGDLARQYQAVNVMLAKQSPQAAAGFRAMVTGTLDNADAQKLLRSSSGEVLGSMDALNKGQINGAQFITQLGRSVGETNKMFNKTAQVTDSFGETFIDYAQGQQLATFAQNDVNKAYDKTLEQQKQQTKNTEKELADQVDTREKQKEAAMSMQEMIRKFVSVAGDITNGLSNLWSDISSIMLKIANAVGGIVDYIKYDILKIPKPGTARAGPSGMVGEQLNQQQYAYWKDIAGRRGIEAVPQQWRAAIQQEQQTGKPPTWNMPAQPGAAPGGTGAGKDLDKERMQKYLQSVALVESGGNRRAGAGTSSAQGLFQFTEGTWKDTAKAMGKNWSLDDRMDPTKSAEAAAYLSRMNAAAFQKEFGRTPSNEELYMMHFLGAGGAIPFFKALTNNPGTTAADVVGFKAASANANIFTDKKTGRQRSVGEVYQLMSGKIAGGALGAASGVYQNQAVSQDVMNIPQLAMGGIASGPESGYLANLHGREAVLPLPNGDSVPIALNIEQLMKSMTASLNTATTSNSGGGGIVELLSTMRDMVTVQRDQNDLVTQLLHAQRA
jgi:hypothetical protein